MAVLIQRGESSDPNNPVLDLWVVSGGALVEPFSLEFAIYDVSDAAKLAAPVQVYPGSGRQAVDLENDALVLGHYVARWTVPGGEAPGRHQIRWWVTLEEGAQERSMREDFDVLTGAVLVPLVPENYILVSDMRDEGVTVASANDMRVQMQIAIMSRRIEQITGRRFAPYYAEHEVDGSRARSLRFGDPIIALTDLARFYSDSDQVEDVLAETYEVYDRHIRQNLFSPDDRMDPRVTFKEGATWGHAPLYGANARLSLRWPRSFAEGPQRYRACGLFGYTDPDGSFTGGTPLGIREACKLMVLKALPVLTSPTNTASSGGVAGVLEERTRDQSVKYGSTAQDQVGTAAGVGDLTGDAVVDQLLSYYMAPPYIGQV